MSAGGSASDTEGETASASDTEAGPASASDTDGGEPACTPLPCDADQAIHQCGDCLDNDGDGLVDCADPDCFGPCDDNEDLLGSSLEDKDPCKQDCYFDGNAGQGGGDCQWNLKCDILQPGGFQCPYSQSMVDNDKCVDGDKDTCADHCSPPNGCDCFGCCTFEDDVDRFIGSQGCTAETPEKCLPCTKQLWCNNPCDADDAYCFPQIEPSLCSP